MKKLKLVLLGLLVSLTANAINELKEYDRISLTLKDGSYYEIPINGNSWIYSTVEGRGVNAKQVVYIKGDNCEYQFDREEIKSLVCHELVSGINDITTENAEKLRYESGHFKVHPSLEGEYMSVYDILGRLIMHTQITDKSVISLDHLPAGVYVAKVKNESIKVDVR